MHTAQAIECCPISLPWTDNSRQCNIEQLSKSHIPPQQLHSQSNRHDFRWGGWANPPLSHSDAKNLVTAMRPLTKAK